MQNSRLSSDARDEILDEVQKSNPQKKIQWLFGSAIVLFVYWYFGGFFNAPYTGMTLLVGLLILLVVMVLRFAATESKRLYHYLYFAGKLALVAAIYLYLMHLPYTQGFIWVATACFGGGILALSFQKN
jgi:uncharacterized membrane protein YgcG